MFIRVIIVSRVTNCPVYDPGKLNFRFVTTSKRVLRIVIGALYFNVKHRGNGVNRCCFISQQIQEINSQVAQYRDLLINIGQPRDCPELREKIRRLRRNCVETCRHTSQLILPQVRRYGTSYDFFPLFLSPRFLFSKC